MVIGLKSAAFSFVAVVGGIFSIQVITMLEHFFIRPIRNGR
jgi:hypothetical protein